ncbi:hypothetical protein VTI28DRAFT_3876 [Corynascus sepedonium]
METKLSARQCRCWAATQFWLVHEVQVGQIDCFPFNLLSFFFVSQAGHIKLRSGKARKSDAEVTCNLFDSMQPSHCIQMLWAHWAMHCAMARRTTAGSQRKHPTSNFPERGTATMGLHPPTRAHGTTSR